ncbi:MAG: thioredoxin family protein [Saprospiraceae bacterium]|nr:thioredoxin family protein [Saprospiraceae bacterium]
MRTYRILNLCFVIFFCFSVDNSQAQGIEFEKGKWDEILNKAKENNKPIFVDAYTTWCGPCKWMSKNIFTQSDVGIYFKDNFIAYKMDMEKGEGPEFAKNYKIRAYPTLLYFSSQGDLIHKGIGARDGKKLISLSNDALNPNKQLYGFQKKYDAGNRDKTFLKSYIDVLLDIGVNISVPYKEYWSLLEDTEKQTEEGLELMAKGSSKFNNFKGMEFQYLLKHKSIYEKAVGKEKINNYITGCYIRSIWSLARNKDKKLKNQLSKEMLKLFPQFKKEFKKRLEFIECTLETPPDNKKIEKANAKYLKVSTDWKDLNRGAWDVYEKSDDIKKIKEALGWVNRSIEIDLNYYNLDTKAAILYKIKNYVLAKEFAQKALKIAEESGFEEQPEGTVLLLKNINLKLAKEMD